jgi:hypothetical protein
MSPGVLVGNMVVRAPQARQRVARGEREARSPWNRSKKEVQAWKADRNGQECLSPLRGKVATENPTD